MTSCVCVGNSAVYEFDLKDVIQKVRMHPFEDHSLEGGEGFTFDSLCTIDTGESRRKQRRVRIHSKIASLAWRHLYRVLIIFQHDN